MHTPVLLTPRLCLNAAQNRHVAHVCPSVLSIVPPGSTSSSNGYGRAGYTARRVPCRARSVGVGDASYWPRRVSLNRISRSYGGLEGRDTLFRPATGPIFSVPGLYPLRSRQTRCVALSVPHGGAHHAHAVAGPYGVAVLDGRFVNRASDSVAVAARRRTTAFLTNKL